MRLLWIAIVGLSASAAPASAQELPDWLAGCWSQEAAAEWTEECWMKPRGGTMIGAGRSGKGTTATGFEYMRIAPCAGGGLCFYGSPMGSPATPFRLVRHSARELVFENAAHDYPQRVRYWRLGKTLHAEISDLANTQVMGWVYRRAR